MRLRWVVLVVFALGATAVSYFVWYSSHDDECLKSWNYQVGDGVETPEAAMEAIGVDPRDFDLTDSSESEQSFVDGSRTITVTRVGQPPGWAAFHEQPPTMITAAVDAALGLMP